MNHTTSQAYICDAIRTPFGRYGGALSSVRTDDLGAIPLKALMARNPNVDWLAHIELEKLVGLAISANSRFTIGVKSGNQSGMVEERTRDNFFARLPCS